MNKNYNILPTDEQYTTKLNMGYQEIFRLADMIIESGLQYQMRRLWDGWQIVVSNGLNQADIIEHHGSYGHESDLLESYGFKEDDNDVRGWLTAEEAFESVKNFYADAE